MSEFRAKNSEWEQGPHAPPVLAGSPVPASRFLDVATCGPSFVTEFLGEPAPLPIDGDRYTTVDVLISFIAVMSMRYGLNREAVGKAIRFLKRHNLEQLNAELGNASKHRHPVSLDGWADGMNRMGEMSERWFKWASCGLRCADSRIPPLPRRFRACGAFCEVARRLASH